MNKQGSIYLITMALLVLFLMTVYVLWDVTYQGPQVVWYNERCERIVKEQQLIGQSEDAVRTALGKPTSVYGYKDAGSFTLNYAPHPSFPFAKFQAHFHNNRLRSIELYDD